MDKEKIDGGHYTNIYDLKTKHEYDEEKNELTLKCEVKIRLNRRDGKPSIKAKKLLDKAIEKSIINPIWYFLNEHRKFIKYEEKRRNDPFM